ncbi:MAG TPA: transposase [Hyphomicrobiaceae bacterium]|nr:transposase [Hyphomicrobiaceae bacterium]
MDRDINNDVHNDVSKPRPPRRVEVLNGPGRRRKWPDETKIAIVAEALEPGVVITDVARRHDINPSQLSGWVRQFRDEALALLGQECPPEKHMFVPAVVAGEASPTTPQLAPSAEPASIEILIGPAMVRLRGAVDTKALSAVLKALKVLA